MTASKVLSINRVLMLWVVVTLLLVTFMSSVSPERLIKRSLLDVYDDQGWELKKAAKTGNLTGVKMLIGMGVDINFLEGDPLSDSSEQGHTEIVKFLLDSGANPNATNEDVFARGRPLKKAAENNHLEIIDLLLEAGSILEPQRFGNTALDLAVENGHIEAVKKLLKAGSDPRRNASYYLVSAAYRGFLEIFKILLAAGSKISDRPDRIIDEAAGKGNLEIIKVTIETGLEREYYDVGLKRAAQRGHLEVVKYLVEQGADVNTKDALSDACTYGTAEVVKYLLEKGANITCDEDSSICPWHSAAKNGKADVIALLVEYGIDINAPLEEDLTDYDDSKYGKGWTVMHFAAHNGYPIVKELLDLGAEINVQDARGQTPLQLAVKEKKFMTVKEMLKFCADLTLAEETGKTALDFAREVESENATRVTYMSVVTALKDKFHDKIETSANNIDTEYALAEEFVAFVKADEELNKDIGDIIRWPIYVRSSLLYIFDERARGNMTRIIEDHKCKEFSHDFSMAPIGTEFLFKCDCVPGQGPLMTISSPTTQKQTPSLLECGSTESPIQEVTSTEFAMVENSTDIPVETKPKMEAADN